jgi:hypothetical protein
MRNKPLTTLAVCLLLALIGCPSEDAGSAPDDSGKTFARFINDNPVPVTIYSDSTRIIKITDIADYETSAKVETAPNAIREAHFFPTYHLVFDSVEIPYQADEFLYRYSEGNTADITVPLLSGDTLVDKDGVYLKVVNASSTSGLILRKGASEVVLQGNLNTATLLNFGETGIYYLPSGGPVSDYSFRRDGVTEVSFPSGLTQFLNGYVYTLRFTDSAISLVSQKQLRLSNRDTSPPKLTWSGSWERISDTEYRSNPIDNSETTKETLSIRTEVSRSITATLTASCHSSDKGRASGLDSNTPVMEVSGSEIKSYQYHITSGTKHEIIFVYVKDVSNTARGDNVTVKITL